MNLNNGRKIRSRTSQACAVAMAVVVMTQASVYGFEIYNDTTYAMRATVAEGDFVEVIPPGEVRACNWQNSDCNPFGAQDSELTLSMETLDSNGRDFKATVILHAGAQAYIHEESRGGMNLAPLFYVDSWNVAGTVLVDNTRLGIGEESRSVRFLVTADCQYEHPGGVFSATRSPIANATTSLMTSMARTDANRIRGIIYAGDLTQNARRDEWEAYLASFGDMGEFLYDGMGNHDLANDRPCITTSPDGCTIRDEIAETIRNRKHRTTKTDKAPGDDPHYSWDWHDVHFVQLNLFPGNEPTDDPDAPDGADDLDPANALTFLINDLADHVGNSGRPIVLIHHYGFDPFTIPGHWWSEAERVAYWNAIADYNVAGIFTGHWHPQENDEDWDAWRTNWARPDNAVGGPEEIPTFCAGASLFGMFLDVEINDKGRMTVTRRVNDGRIQSVEYVDLGPDDFIDRNSDNDSCATAVALNPFGEDLPNLRIIDGDEDWYQVYVPSNAELRVDITFRHDVGNLDLILYRGCGLLEIKRSDSVTDNESINWVNPGAGRDVYLRVLQRSETRPGVVGYDLSVHIGEDAFEENDSCATVKPITPGDYSNLTVLDDDEDWYRVTIPAATTMAVELLQSASALDVEFEVWEDCGNGPVITSDQNGQLEHESYHNDAPERDVYIRVFVRNGFGQENYDLSIEFQPLQLFACEAVAETFPGDYPGLAVYDGADDWIKFATQADSRTTVALDFDHSSGNIDLELWNACNGILLMASASQTDGESLSYEGVGFGEMIYARVRMADAGGYNQYDLSISHRPTSAGADDCADATRISGDGAFLFNTTDATIDGVEHPLCDFFNYTNIDHDVWYDWTATHTGTATLSVCPLATSLDTKFAVYEGTSCTGDIIACDDDTCEVKSELNFDCLKGEQYKIRCGTYLNAATGTSQFKIKVEDAYGRHDDCSDPVLLTPGVYENLVVQPPAGTDYASTDWWAVMVDPNTRLTVDLLYGDGVVFDPIDDFLLRVPTATQCPGPLPPGTTSSAISGGRRITTNNVGVPRLYLIGVNNSDASNTQDGVNYTLRITESISDDHLEPNDACESAAVVAPGFYTDLRCADDDYYAVALPETSILDVNAFFQQSDGDLSLLVYRTCGEQVALSNSATDDEWVQYVNTGPAETVLIRVVRSSPTGIVPYAMDVSITDIDDCNANGIDDAVEIAEQLTEDCNANGLPDSCDIKHRLLFLNLTDVDDSVWLGMPDDIYAGIGSETVTYSLGTRAVVVDGPGSDFNIYEADVGGPEFDKIRVFVGNNVLAAFTEITATEAPVVRIPGDEQHGDDAFARSYDIGAAGFSTVSYIRIRGQNVSGPAGGVNGFDLDAMGIIYVAPSGCPVDFDGDLNCDSVVDLADAMLFGKALVDPASFPAYEAFCPMQRADVNRDGRIDGNDAQGFVELLTMP